MIKLKSENFSLFLHVKAAVEDILQNIMGNYYNGVMLLKAFRGYHSGF